MPNWQAKLYAELAHDLDAHSRPRAAHGAFAAFVKNLGAGRYKRYAAFHGRTLQWLRLLRNANRTFGKGLQRLLGSYGSARVLWATKLKAAGQLRVQRGRLIVTKGPGAGNDLAEFTSAEVDELLVHRPLRARRRAGGPAISGQVFRLPRDAEEIARYLRRRLKSLVPSKAVSMPRFVIREREGPTTVDTKARARVRLEELERLIDVVRDVIREIKPLLEKDDPAPVKLRGQGRGERVITGVAIDNRKLAARLIEVGRPRGSAQTT